jgi:hypothetical protein
VIVDAPTVARIPAASRPPHFHARVRRWRSSEPRSVAVSSPARGGSRGISESVIRRPYQVALQRVGNARPPKDPLERTGRCQRLSRLSPAIRSGILVLPTSRPLAVM